MACPEPLDGDELLTAVTDALAALHERHYGRRPAAARSMFMGDDLLACVMGGVYTEVEKTLIELERQPLVSESRSAFQHAMGHRLIEAVQTLCGREVQTFMSTSHVGPDLEVELFVLEPVP
jgi:uncharacterized protein YbcI